MAKLFINNKTVEVPDQYTILEAAQEAGISIPTLCFLKGVSTSSSCRVCLVEVEGARNLMSSCSAPVSDGMVVWTNSSRVRAARKTIVELLLSEHQGDCQTCVRNQDCELQKIAATLGIQQIPFEGEKPTRLVDHSTKALERDSGKCVKCRRCVSVCGETQTVGALFPQNRGYETQISPAFCSNLEDVACVQCGQCAAVCPVGAIQEVGHSEKVWKALSDKNKFVVVQTAPAIRAALGECFDYEPGTLVTGKMVSALEELGFDGVFDTNFAADLTIMEEGSELLMRLKDLLVEDKQVALPQLTSCSPGWIKFMEYYYPGHLPMLSTCKSPQQMFGAIAKTYYAKKVGVNPEDMVVVSVMPCTAKKFEADRAEMNDSGYRDVDFVLTTRELGQMIKEAGIDFRGLPDTLMHNPLGVSSGAADIFANTGGVMEAALRTCYEIVTGRLFPADDLHVAPLEGLDGVKTCSLEMKEVLPEWSFLEGATLQVGVAHGLENARTVMDRVIAGEMQLHFLEVMTCSGGCIGGGGQPRMTTDEIRKKRMKAIFREDEGKEIRKSHMNPQIKALYDEFLGAPLSEKSHHLLHTHYVPRPLVAD